MMNTLVTAAALSDHDLLARLGALATKEREASVELVVHLAALDSRPSVYAAEGYASLFAYCTQELRLSEDAACNRIEAARACRRFPSILDHLASGALTLTWEIPNGDPAVIFDQAITLLLERVEARKVGRRATPRRRTIRPATDREIRTPIRASRDVPQAVKDEVHRRDGAQCAFVSSSGRRCSEREFLEFHHVQAYARQGPATPGNIALRCRRHNQYEAELAFGPRQTSAPVGARPAP